MNTPKIIALIEPNQNQQPALIEAIKLAKQLECEVIALLCVYEFTAELDALVTGTIIKNARMPVIESAQNWLDNLLKTLNLPDTCTVHSKVYWQKYTDQTIEHLTREDHIQMVVSHQSRSSNWFSSLLHGHDWRLIHQSPCDLLLINPQTSLSYRHAILALDTHDPAHQSLNEKIIKQARQLSDLYGLKLSILHAYPTLDHSGLWGVEPDPSLLEQAQNSIIEAHKTATEQFAKAHGFSEEHVVFVAGEPHEVVRQQVIEQNAGLLILGNKHDQGLPGTFFNHDFNQTIKNTDCSLYIVRP